MTKRKMPETRASKRRTHRLRSKPKRTKLKRKIFKDFFFYIDEHPLFPKPIFKKIILSNGGQIQTSLSPKVTHFISSNESILAPTKNVLKALKSKIDIYPFEYLFSQNKTSFIPLNHLAALTSSNSDHFELSQRTLYHLKKPVRIELLTLGRFLVEGRFEGTKKSVKKRKYSNQCEAKKAFYCQIIKFTKTGLFSSVKIPKNASFPKSYSCSSLDSLLLNDSSTKLPITMYPYDYPLTKRQMPPSIITSIHRFLWLKKCASEKKIGISLHGSKDKYLAKKEIKRHVLSKGGSVVNVSKDSILFGAISKTTTQKKAKHLKDKKFLKTVFMLRPKGGLKDDVYCKVYKKGTVVYTLREGVLEHHIESNDHSAFLKYQSLCLGLSGEKNSTKIEEQSGLSIFQDKNDCTKNWWQHFDSCRKFLCSRGIYISSRVTFSCFSDFEAIDDSVHMDQVEVSIYNSGRLPSLISAYNKLTNQPLTYNQLAQKYFLVRLLFMVGHSAGFLLTSFVKFYMRQDLCDSKPLRSMTAISFEDCCKSAHKSTICGFVFDENSSKIKHSLEENTEKKEFIRILRKALKGDAFLVD